jgi:hypothetical protein
VQLLSNEAIRLAAAIQPRREPSQFQRQADLVHWLLARGDAVQQNSHDAARAAGLVFMKAAGLGSVIRVENAVT